MRRTVTFLNQTLHPFLPSNPRPGEERCWWQQPTDVLFPGTQRWTPDRAEVFRQLIRVDHALLSSSCFCFCGPPRKILTFDESRQPWRRLCKLTPSLWSLSIKPKSWSSSKMFAVKERFHLNHAHTHAPGVRFAHGTTETANCGLNVAIGYPSERNTLVTEQLRNNLVDSFSFLKLCFNSRIAEDNNKYKNNIASARQSRIFFLNKPCG